MPQNFNDIKSKTVCSDCGGKEMVLGYTASEGAIHKKTSVLGMEAYSRATTKVMVICKNCGLVVKSYAENPQKL